MVEMAVDFFAVELPATQAPGGGQRRPLELLELGLHLALAGQLLEVVANRLVQALAHRLRRGPGALGDALVDGECDVHSRFPASVRTVYVLA